MSQIERDLVDEFSRLRHGWGLEASDLRKRLGAKLSALADVAPSDNDRVIRQKLMALIKGLTSDFTDEDRAAADLAFGALPGTQHRLLSVRVARLAQQERIADRTARRWIDRATERLAQEAAARLAAPSPDGEPDPEKGWHVARFEALLRLDTAAPELTETRTIVAGRDGLDAIAVRFSLPRRDDQPDRGRDVHVDVQYGARLLDMRREGEAHFRLLLGLPRTLPRGAAHTYALTFRVPEGQPMRQHYAFVPLVECESFLVRVRFDGSRLPRAAWRINHTAPRTLTDRQVPGEPLQLDGAYEATLEFTKIERGFGYGVAWAMPEDPVV